MAKREELVQTANSIRERIWWLLTRQQQLMGRDDRWACEMFARNEDELARARHALAKVERKLATMRW